MPFVENLLVRAVRKFFWQFTLMFNDFLKKFFVYCGASQWDASAVGAYGSDWRAQRGNVFAFIIDF